MAKQKKQSAKDKKRNVVQKGRSGNSPVAAAESVKGLRAWLDRAKAFLKEVRIEFDRVTWPSKKDAMAMTTAVLAITLLFTVFLGVVDISLSKFVGFLIY